MEDINRIIFINPIYMILIFILLSTINALSHYYLILYDSTFLLLSILLYGWPIIFINYAHKKHNSISELQQKRSEYLFLYIIFVQLLPLFLDFYYKNKYNYKNNSMLSFLFVITTFVSIFYILWTASKSLVIAEMREESKNEDKIQTNRIIGTFFEFFYLPIFVVFLVKRLRALEKFN